MNIEETELYLNSLCHYLLHKCNLKKIDIYSIFRTLTNKKYKLSINLEKFNLTESVDQDELQEFIATVNPFYDFNSGQKTEYYTNYFLISKTLQIWCSKMIEESTKACTFKLYDLTNNRYLTEYNLDEIKSKSNINIAIFTTKEEAVQAAKAHLKLYQYLDIEKKIQVWCYNNQEVLIERNEVN
jgi:hypothetical protein